MDFKKLGFMPADILLPKNQDMEKWACVACDQYTSEPEYWEKVKKFVGDSKSTLNLIFHEVYLGKNDDETIKNINSSMEKYLSEDTLKVLENCFIYFERKLINGKIRKGIVGKIDLERYDYSKGSKSLIRATEETVLSRIPPRVKIRENAILELPHIMLLINDSKSHFIENTDTSSLEKLYDFDLMMNSGHINGYKLNPTEEIYKNLEFLFGKSENPLVYAVGDGNHSLATAKTCWENLKQSLSEEEMENHPARFALVELVNIHDESLEFEPIHRVMFNVNPIDVIDELKKFYKTNTDGKGQKITYCFGDENRTLYVENSAEALEVGTLQKFIDKYLENNSDGMVDYIHGEDVVVSLSKKDNAIGFILSPMDKSDLFNGIEKGGSLPRKTFSMGEASEKRFYIEARKIK